jgi:hypothetical protein
MFATEHFGVAVTLLTCIQGVLGSNNFIFIFNERLGKKLSCFAPIETMF